MCPRSRYNGLVDMGATRSYGPMRIFFVVFDGGVLKSWYISSGVKFGANLAFHVPKMPVY